MWLICLISTASLIVWLLSCCGVRSDKRHHQDVCVWCDHSSNSWFYTVLKSRLDPTRATVSAVSTCCCFRSRGGGWFSYFFCFSCSFSHNLPGPMKSNHGAVYQTLSIICFGVAWTHIKRQRQTILFIQKM